MFGRTSLLKTTALALPFSLAAVAAHAASIAETVQQNEQLGTFAKAMETANFGEQLSGEGPYTVFAPSDQAFEQLPQDALDQLMKQDSRAQLTKLLEHHVIEGQAIAADDVLGKQTQIDTMSGDTLTIDGTSQVVLLVPTGLTIARVGDRVVIEREGVAVATPAIAVEGQGAQTQGQQESAAETPVTEGSDMPATEHQQQVLESQPGQEQRQTAAEGTAMPSTEHQREVLREGPQQTQQQQVQDQGQEQALQQQPQGQTQQGAAETPVTEGADMPVTEHQQEVLESQPGQEQRQTAPEVTAMPSTEHQRQALAEGEQPDAAQAPGRGQSDILREAHVITAGIEADNGVIHVIDAVLVPPEVLQTLEQQPQG